MKDGCRGTRFLDEARGKLWLGAKIRAQHLQRKTLAQSRVTNGIHSAHAAFAQQLFHSITTIDRGPEQRVHGCVARSCERLAVEWAERSIRGEPPLARGAGGRMRRARNSHLECCAFALHGKLQQ